LSFPRLFQLSLACFRVARSPSNSWASCITTGRRYCDPSYLYVGWLLHSKYCWGRYKSFWGSIKLQYWLRNTSNNRSDVILLHKKVYFAWFWEGMYTDIPPVATPLITSKMKHAIKHKTSPARLAQLLQPSLALCFILRLMKDVRGFF